MAKLQLTLPDGVSVSNGKQVTFKIPTDCNNITSVVIEGTEYAIYDTSGNSIESKSFTPGSMMSIIVDTEDTRAVLLSGVSEVFLTTISGNETDGYTCDKTLEEIAAANSADQIVISKYGDSRYILSDCSNGSATFYKCDASGSDVTLSVITVNEVDGKQEAIVQSTDLMDKNGSTMSGPLVLTEDPTEDMQAATKQYVDTTIETSLAAFSTKPYTISETEPANKNLFWIDSANGNFMKAYDDATSTWVPISAAYG